MTGFDVYIRRNVTGETRVYHDVGPYVPKSELGSTVFQWRENNYSCDCNRFLFFERAGGREPDLDDAVCGDGEYTVTHVRLPDGTTVQIDDEGGAA